MNETNPNWERDAITQLAESSLREQKRARKWSIFFKLLTFAYVAIVLIMFAGAGGSSPAAVSSTHTALVNLNGVIADGENANADTIVSALRNAFDNSHAKGVILRINSPGGTPVQAGYIYDEIIRLRKLHPDTPLYAVITDVCASGGYYVAAAADKIFANKASIVGSIGVRMDNFGFVDAMKKLGVERRTITAGENKALMDPFSPVDRETRQHMQTMLNNVHEQFITAVKDGRGDRLNTDTEGLFSGLIWTGQESISIGLVDELASASHVAREIIGEESIVDYTLREDLLERLAGRVGASMASVLGQNMGFTTLN